MLERNSGALGNRILNAGDDTRLFWPLHFLMFSFRVRSAWFLDAACMFRHCGKSIDAGGGEKVGLGIGRVVFNDVVVRTAPP